MFDSEFVNAMYTATIIGTPPMIAFSWNAMKCANTIAILG